MHLNPLASQPIRDRLSGIPGIHLLPPLLYPQFLKLLTRACLLYTSDAADERSSVDLGGRRILKKKNIQKKKKERGMCNE